MAFQLPPLSHPLRFVQPRRQPGMTLVELLVVIVILALLTAAALPVLTPSTTERRLRESSRELNAYLSRAQANAIRTQRPYGIALKRLSSETGKADDRGVCVEVMAVEQPAPYCGFDENSRMRVAHHEVPTTNLVYLQFLTRNPNSSSTGNSNGIPLGWMPDLVPSDLIRVGDVVEVAGSRFIIHPSSSSNLIGYIYGNDGSTIVQVTAQPLGSTGQLINPVRDNEGTRISAGNLTDKTPYWSEPLRYKILRQPTPTSVEPLQLPDGIAVDLEASGIFGEVPFHYSDGNSGTILNETVDDSPIYILFSPDGNIERVQLQRVQQDGAQAITQLITPTNNVALLVGRRELIPADTTLDLTSGSETQQELEKSKLNWLNLESRWVVIGAQTGAVVTSENAFVSPGSLTTVDFDGNGDTFLNRRRTQIQAAQEFARELKRTGGS